MMIRRHIPLENLPRTVLLSLVCSGILNLTALPAPAAEQPSLQRAREIFAPLPNEIALPGVPVTAPQVKLGRMLFFDPRLSADGTVSCATCHKPALYGTDALSRSIGAEHRANLRNAPTVLNAALHFRF